MTEEPSGDPRSAALEPRRLVIRAREERHLDELATIAVEVQRRDGYPGPHVRDLKSFLVVADALGAWIAELDGRTLGQVVLRRSAPPVVMTCAREALGVTSDDELAVVARLIVDPRMRRLGAGQALLGQAAAAARAVGRHPILDVATRHVAASSLYDAARWTNVGEVEVKFPDEIVIQAFVYIAPPDHEDADSP
jgi:GNAT superfamily N-acetyltransferase